MKIGQLAERTGVSTRQLRYYEQQGLLQSERGNNNYRDYAEESIESVRQIRHLIEGGMPTRIIRELLPCVNGPSAEMPPTHNTEMADMLNQELCTLRERIEMLTKARELVECYLDRVR